MRIVLFLLCFLLVLSCSKPKDPRNREYSFQEFPKVGGSTINASVNISIREIENLLNNKLQGNLLQDATIKDPTFNGLKLSLERSGPVAVDFRKNIAYISIPTSFHIYGDLAMKMLGATVKQAVDVKLDAQVGLKSTVDVTQNWKLATTSSLASIEWLDKPQIKLGIITISAPNLIEKQIQKFAPELVALVDKEVIPKVDIRKTCENVWVELQKNRAVKTDFSTFYFNLKPDSVAYAGLSRNEDFVALDLTLWNHLGFTLSAEDDSLLPLPELKKNRKFSEGFDLQLGVEVPYSGINSRLNQLKGKELKLDQHKIVIEELEVYGAGDKLGVFVRSTGDAAAELFLSGKVFYDTLNDALFIHQLEYELKNEDFIVSVGEWLYSDDVLEQLEKQLVFPIGEHVAKIPDLLETGIGKKSRYQKLRIDVNEFSLNPKSIFVGEKSLFIHATSQGKATLYISKFSTEKNT